VYAINKLMRARDDEQYASFRAARIAEFEARGELLPEAAHAAEDAACAGGDEGGAASPRSALARTWGAAPREAEERGGQRSRAKVDDLTSRPPTKKSISVHEIQKREEAARLAKREARREDIRRREEEREVLRAQVYAINELMRCREEAAYLNFVSERHLCVPGAEPAGDCAGGSGGSSGGGSSDELARSSSSEPLDDEAIEGAALA